MQWTVSSTTCADLPADLLVLPVFQKNGKPDFKPVGKILGGGKTLTNVLDASGFNAKAEALLPIPTHNTKAGWVLLVGMGDAKDLGLDKLRKSAARAAAKARAMDAARVVVNVPAAKDLGFDDQSFARCWVEGAEMGLSPMGDLKSGQKKGPKSPKTWKFAADAKRGRALRAGLAEGKSYADGCLLARDLVNMPPNYLTPAVLASRARRVAKAEGFKCTVLGVPQLKKLNMGGILGVGQGSVNPPRLIVLEKKHSAKAPTISLVGKGVTFDSGGISLKPGLNMDIMKCDMGGAAAVLGAALIISRLNLPVNLQVLMPAAENMPDGNAVKPADVITMANGQTVEVLNTDAEGRLILGDALWYAGKGKPDYIMDAATLTGACVVALGNLFAGVMGNSGELIETLEQAGGETFERVWHMPLVDEHKKTMEGTWGDLKNIGGGREAGASTAAAFLASFVDDETAWAHIDIAGPSWADSASAISPKGGTGFGARLMARAVQILVG